LVGSAVTSGLDQTFQVVSDRWNILSLPYYPPNDTVAALYAGATNPTAYTYSSGYVPQTTVKPGAGYWLKFNGAEVIIISGSPVLTADIVVQQGWNMVGSISSDVAASTVTSVPPSLIQTPFYQYKAGYTPAPALHPGSGYWVKTSGAGRLVMSSISSSAPKVDAIDNRLDRLNAITITDAAGNAQTLYFGTGSEFSGALAAFELPPPPPPGVFDARFASGRMVDLAADGKNGSFPISVSSAAYPMTVAWNLKNSTVASLNIGGTVVAMTPKGHARVNANSSIAVDLSSKASLPTQYSLSQNYPNPFNPSTIIKFDLPVNGYVTLTVYNILGQPVVKLVDGIQAAGYKSVEFNAAALPSGVYFYRINAGAYTATKKLLLMK